MSVPLITYIWDALHIIFLFHGHCSWVGLSIASMPGLLADYFQLSWNLFPNFLHISHVSWSYPHHSLHSIPPWRIEVFRPIYIIISFSFIFCTIFTAHWDQLVLPSCMWLWLCLNQQLSVAFQLGVMFGKHSCICDGILISLISCRFLK